MDVQQVYSNFIDELNEAVETRGFVPFAQKWFVPDGALRTIPMSALHDGNHFLVERYAVAVTPGLSLVDPHPLDRAARLLLAGVSQGN